MSSNGYVVDRKRGAPLSMVVFSGLVPGTKYTYRISSIDGQVNQPEESFETSRKSIVVRPFTTCFSQSPNVSE